MKTEMKRPANRAWPAAFLLAPAAAFAWLAALPAERISRSPRPDRPLPSVSVEAEPEAAESPAPTPGSAPDLILYGVSGVGPTELAAIIGSGTGGQRLVRVGKEFQPGLRLTEVGPDYAVLAAGGRPARLKLRRFGAPSAELAAARPDSEKERGIEAAVLRQTLRPVVSNGRIGGYALKGGEILPQLQAAGLRAGDVILSVNGSQFDAERLGDLPWEMRNASKTEFVFLRAGKKKRVIFQS